MFTSWNTTKYRVVDGERIKKIYPYYGCSNNNCTQRVNINQTKLENEFTELLCKTKVSKGIIKLVELNFEEVAKLDQRKRECIISAQKQRVLELNRKLAQIETSILSATIPALFEKLEKERKNISDEKNDLEEKLANSPGDGLRTKNLLEKTIKLFQNPDELWKVGSPTMRQLLMKVRF